MQNKDLELQKICQFQSRLCNMKQLKKKNRVAIIKRRLSIISAHLFYNLFNTQYLQFLQKIKIVLLLL